jgi:hypothetical protein
LERKREPLLPENGSERANGARDLPLLAGIERKRDEAQAGVADSDLVDVEIERGGEVLHGHSRIGAQEP